MGARLRVGILGLGRRWRRWAAALAAQVEVRAVCDPQPARAACAARRLGCIAAAGPVELLERGDVRAAVILDAGWWGLWPLGRACRARKPVLCVGAPGPEEDVEELRRLVRESGVAVLTAPDPGLALRVAHLRRLLSGTLGAARLVRVAWSGPSDSALPGLLQACGELLGAPPVAVRAASAAGAAGFTDAVLEYGTGAVAHASTWADPGVATAWRVEVVAERGRAEAECPGGLTWHDAAGRHALQPPAGAAQRHLLLRFAEAVLGSAAPRPDFEDACAARRWVDAVRRSLAEGRRIDVGPV
jgi:predicted dehydrogenase